MKLYKKLTPLGIAEWMVTLDAVNARVEVDTITLICPHCKSIWMVAYDGYFEHFINHIKTHLIAQSKEGEL